MNVPESVYSSDFFDPDRKVIICPECLEDNDINITAEHLAECRQWMDGLNSQIVQSMMRSVDATYDCPAPTYVARSVLKLHEIDKEFDFLRNRRVLDIGSSPGSWTEYCTKICSHTMSLTGPNPLSRYADFGPNKLCVIKGEIPIVLLYSVDVIICDAADIRDYEHQGDDHSVLLTNLYDSLLSLRDGGTLLFKVLDTTSDLHIAPIERIVSHFETVVVIKPKLSRAASSEKFIFCRNFSTQRNKYHHHLRSDKRGS